MRLPFLQVAQEAWIYARMIAGLLGINRHHAMGMLIDMWAWGVELGPKDEPPTGAFESPRAPQALAAVLEWTGDAGALAVAFEEAGVIELHANGLRVKGLSRYAVAFLKTENLRVKWRRANEKRKDAAVTAELPPSNRAVTAALPLPKTQTQTQTHIEEKILRAKTPAEPKEPKAPKPPPDPRHTPLVKALCDAYAEVMHADYAFGGRDAKCVTTLLAKSEDDEEILFRWRLALERSLDKFQSPKTRNLPDFARDWNSYPATRDDTHTREMRL